MWEEYVGSCESMAEGRALELQEPAVFDNSSTGRVTENTHFYGAREKVIGRGSLQTITPAKPFLQVFIEERMATATAPATVENALFIPTGANYL